MDRKDQIIIVDDDRKNLSIAAEVAGRFTKKGTGIEVVMTDSAEKALEFINNDNNTVGVVTDLLFPAEQPFNDAVYGKYLNEIEKHAKQVLMSDKMLRSCFIRMERQLKLLRFTGDELAYGGGIALKCANEYIPFVIVSDTYRHVLSGSEYDGATLFVPFYAMGFIKIENLWSDHYSRHVLWGANKKSIETWERAFKELAAQWSDFRSWKRQCSDPVNKVHQPNPESRQTYEIKPASLKKMWEIDYCVKVEREEAGKIVDGFSKVDSKYSQDTQIYFVQRALESMREIRERVAAIQAKSLIWIPSMGNIRLNPPSWNPKIFRPDIGIIVATFNKNIDCRSYKGGCDWQNRNEVIVWTIDSTELKSVYVQTWWEWRDDLESPTITKVNRKKVELELYMGPSSLSRKEVINISS